MSVNSSFNLTDCALFGLAFNVTRVVLLLPLSILVLYLGHQRWRQKRSFTTTSHSDIFTFNTVAMELFWVLASALFICGFSAVIPELITMGVGLSSMSFYGQSFLHLLTYVERYLAVVHPITYRGLREARGVRIRNISIGCVWLLSLALASLITLQLPGADAIFLLCPLVFCLVVVSFCSLSVLRVLIRPVPGDGGRNKERVDQSKQKAVFTITAITGILWLWFFGFLVSIALDASPLLSPSVGCVMRLTALWFSLPSSSVLPLMYLHRAGKPPCRL